MGRLLSIFRLELRGWIADIGGSAEARMKEVRV